MTEPESTLSRMRHIFRRILYGRDNYPELSDIRSKAAHLDVGRLTGVRDGQLSFSMVEVLENPPLKLFGYYSAEGIEYALEELGVTDRIEALGFTDINAVLSGDDWRQTLRLYGSSNGSSHLIMEGRFHRHPWRFPEAFYRENLGNHFNYQVITIEWLMLQNPAAKFTPDRPRLPNQEHPGLGLMDEIMEVFWATAVRLGVDAYIINAKMYHNAQIYSPLFFFLEPARQAELKAIKEAGGDRSLREVTLAVEGGRLYQEGKDQPYEWIGAPMIRPLVENLHQAFRTAKYLDTVDELAANMRFWFDWELFEADRKQIEERVLGPSTTGASE